MKRILIFTGILVAIFIMIAAINSYQAKKLMEINPYGKSELNPETVKQLKDPNYKNIIQPKELDKKIATGKPLAVYFYSPLCPHCKVTSPIVVPMTKEMGLNLPMANLLEFPGMAVKYKIEATPTIIYFSDGKEASRIVGEQDKKVFKEWFSKVKK